VRLPQPENTTEVVKIWLHMPASTELPAKFLDTIRVVFNSVAKQILESQTMAPTKKNIALSNLASNSSSQSVMIPCGILLSLVSFLHIACIHPNIQLVFETYNGKMKGLSVPVKIGTNGEPDLPQASFDLMESCVRTDSLFSIFSKLIRKDILRMKLDSSSFGFGFRAIFTKKTDNKLVLAAVNHKMSTDSRQVQLWPLAYLDTDTCPNLISFNDAKPGGICRSQFYLECFSMQKPSNSNSKWSYSRTSQDLKAAMNKDEKQCSHCKDKACVTLNTSVLRFGLPATCDKLDESFQLFGLKWLFGPLCCKVILKHHHLRQTTAVSWSLISVVVLHHVGLISKPTCSFLITATSFIMVSLTLLHAYLATALHWTSCPAAAPEASLRKDYFALCVTRTPS
jgi:hypothetical protein